MNTKTPTEARVAEATEIAGDMPANLKRPRTSKQTPDTAKHAEAIAKLHNSAAPVVTPADEAKARAAEQAPKPKTRKAKPAKQAKTAPKGRKVKSATGVTKQADKADRQHSIVPMRFKERYAAHNDTCGDMLALDLKEATTFKNEDGRESLDVEALWSIAKANKIDVSKYLTLNNGQKRMNVANRMRGLIKAGGTVKIGNKSYSEKAIVKSPAVRAADTRLRNKQEATQAA